MTCYILKNREPTEREFPALQRLPRSLFRNGIERANLANLHGGKGTVDTGTSTYRLDPAIQGGRMSR